MTKWRVRKHGWKEDKQVVKEEVIEADDVCIVDGALVFSKCSDDVPNRVFGETVKLRAPVEWFAVDKIEDQQKVSIELAACMEHAGEGWHVSNEFPAEPVLA